MALSNKERQTLYRRRARTAKDIGPHLQDMAEGAIRMIEETIAFWREQGARPNDGTPRGALMATQERWVASQRR